ncbi:protein of unknown function [Streptantibioticus cattleyicolor NRRL 8057 = DSM 46488]|nr:protein of unknown function [Streptantibioticus cattleyicolor NRRL 8057 = DSM 46488]
MASPLKRPITPLSLAPHRGGGAPAPPTLARPEPAPCPVGGWWGFGLVRHRGGSPTAGTGSGARRG